MKTIVITFIMSCSYVYGQQSDWSFISKNRDTLLLERGNSIAESTYKLWLVDPIYNGEQPVVLLVDAFIINERKNKLNNENKAQ